MLTSSTQTHFSKKNGGEHQPACQTYGFMTFGLGVR